MKYLKNLTLQQWAWSHFLIALGIVWPVVIITNVPTGFLATLEFTLILVGMFFTFIGALCALVGLIMKDQTCKVRLYGISIELIGTLLLFVGPFLYFVTQLVLATQIGGFTSRGALMVFAYSMCAVIVYRLVMITPQFLQEAHDETKEI